MGEGGGEVVGGTVLDVEEGPEDFEDSARARQWTREGRRGTGEKRRYTRLLVGPTSPTW